MSLSDASIRGRLDAGYIPSSSVDSWRQNNAVSGRTMASPANMFAAAQSSIYSSEGAVSIKSGYLFKVNPWTSDAHTDYHMHFHRREICFILVDDLKVPGRTADRFLTLRMLNMYLRKQYARVQALRNENDPRIVDGRFANMRNINIDYSGNVNAMREYVAQTGETDRVAYDEKYDLFNYTDVDSVYERWKFIGIMSSDTSMGSTKQHHHKTFHVMGPCRVFPYWDTTVGGEKLWLKMTRHYDPDKRAHTYIEIVPYSGEKQVSFHMDQNGQRKKFDRNIHIGYVYRPPAPILNYNLKNTVSYKDVLVGTHDKPLAEGTAYLKSISSYYLIYLAPQLDNTQ